MVLASRYSSAEGFELQLSFYLNSSEVAVGQLGSGLFAHERCGEWWLFPFKVELDLFFNRRERYCTSNRDSFVGAQPL